MERETFVAEQTTAHQHWSITIFVCLSVDIRFRVRCGDTGISAVVVFLCDACFSSFTDYILGISYTNQLHLPLIQCSKISETTKNYLSQYLWYHKLISCLAIIIFVSEIAGGHLVRNANASFRSASAWDSDEAIANKSSPSANAASLIANFILSSTISSYRADFIISANGFSSTRTNSRAGHCKTTLAYDEPPNRWRYPSLSAWTGVVTTEWFPVGSHGSKRDYAGEVLQIMIHVSEKRLRRRNADENRKKQSNAGAQYKTEPEERPSVDCA
ncbi:hypothetical protein T08_16513 [Trichinella sp. T8]|nr:hypothetical protein T08_16513 [Trichinella sp. T8]